MQQIQTRVRFYQTWPSDLWPVWAQASAPFIHFTNSPTVQPMISCTPKQPAGSYDLSGQGTETWMFWSYLYRVTGQPSLLHFLTWCLIAELLSHHAWRHWAMWRMQDCRTRSDRLIRRPLDILNPRPPLHGLAFTNFIDCNTRHVECSTCCVPGLGTHNPTTPQQQQWNMQRY